MEESRPLVSAIILAGGQSRCMGRDKALIDFQGRPIIAHVVDTLLTLSDDVLIVSLCFFSVRCYCAGWSRERLITM